MRPRLARRWKFARIAAFWGLALSALVLPSLMLPASTNTTAATAPATTSQPATRTAEQRRQDDINRVMEFFRLTQPDVYAQAKIYQQTEPEKFDKLITGAIMTVNRFESMKRRNPRLFDLSMRDLQLGYESLRKAHELKRTDLSAADRNRMTQQLKEIVAAEFEIQQQIRQAEIEDLRQRLKDLDTSVRDKQEQKDAIIRKRTEDLLERTPGLMW